jgi:hypothetical protein
MNTKHAILVLSTLLLSGCLRIDGPATASNDGPKSVVEMPDESPTVIAPTDETIEVEEVNVEEETMVVDADKMIAASRRDTQTETHQAPASAGSPAQPVAAAAPTPEPDSQTETAAEPIVAAETVAAAEPAAAAEQAPVAVDEIATAAGGDIPGSSGPGSFTVLLIALLIAMIITAPFMFGGPLYRKITGASKAGQGAGNA